MEKDVIKKNQVKKPGMARFLRWPFSSRTHVIISLVVISIIGYFVWKNTAGAVPATTYQTAQVTRDTLVVSLSESGSVAVSNRMPVSTQASGVVGEVFVKNGDIVAQGQKIATVTLDQQGQQRQSSAYASYLSAQSALNKAQADMFNTQSSMYADWNTYINIAQNSTYQNPDGSPNISNRALPQFTTAQDNWLGAEATYKNQQTVVNQAQAALASAWNSYQQSSSEIDAPAAGVISDLTIASGMQMASSGGGNSSNSSSSSSNTISSNNVATIKMQGNPVITIQLPESDAVKVEPNQKVTVTFDALPNLTFTGKVLGINTTGTVSSGVTSYPATIVLDTGNEKILPNMSANASIITNVKPDVLVVPNAAVQSLGGQSTVRVLKNGQVSVVPVQTGLASDTQTEIVSGLSEGEDVVTSVSGGRAGAAGASPFGGGGFRFGGFGGGGGGAVRVNRGG
ncbi:MAG: efflux RND transporter periplasmic adaptor subunit [Candidatus Levyibacteriota bacterium]